MKGLKMPRYEYELHTNHLERLRVSQRPFFWGFLVCSFSWNLCWLIGWDNVGNGLMVISLCVVAILEVKVFKWMMVYRNFRKRVKAVPDDKMRAAWARYGFEIGTDTAIECDECHFGDCPLCCAE